LGGMPSQGPLREEIVCEEALGGHPARWVGGMSRAQRVPPVQRAGGTHFSKFSQLAPLFRILVFFNPFFEKNSR
jgi:hypothetical protein